MLVPQLDDDPVGADLWQEEAEAELVEVLGEAALGREGEGAAGRATLPAGEELWSSVR